jgi:hypothetical protein
MRRILRQNNLSYTSQKKFSDGHYRFGVEKSERFPLGQAYIIDINAYPVASDFQTPVYIKKDSDEMREEEQHYALVNTLEHTLLESESDKLLRSAHSEYRVAVPLKEYKEQIMKHAKQLKELDHIPSSEGEKA